MIQSPKVYPLTLSPNCKSNCFYAHELGCLSHFPKRSEDLARSLEKAKSGNYTSVLFPCNAEESSLSFEVAQQALDLKRDVIYQINISKEVSIDSYKNLLVIPNCKLHLIIDAFDEDVFEKIKNYESWAPIEYLLLLVQKKKIPDAGFLKKISNLYPDKIRFIFPIKQFLYDSYLSCRQVHRTIKKWRKNIPDIEVKTLEGRDLYEPRLNKAVETEALYQPLITTMSNRDVPIQFSFVIPVYNQKNYVLRTLKAITQQEYDRDLFEVILVDDGSTDGLIEDIKQFLNELDSGFNFQFILFPRAIPRSMGDNNFRAGTARNLGAKFARGEFISFLDADIIIPPHFISQIIEDLKESTLVQSQRYDLTDEFTQSLKDILNINVETDVIKKDRHYWFQFYQKGQDWNQLKRAWKYVCTYSLTMRRETFEQLNGFRKNYTYYGFEDTDIGYRLFHAGEKFKLSSVKVFHQFHHHERSEFKNSHYYRQKVLAKTAKVFYYNNLGDDIYEELIDYMRPTYKISEYFIFLLRLIVAPITGRKSL